MPNAIRIKKIKLRNSNILSEEKKGKSEKVMLFPFALAKKTKQNKTKQNKTKQSLISLRQEK